MTRDGVPTPGELLGCPELAVLAVLQSTMRAAKAMLISTHPDFYYPDEESIDPVFPGSTRTVRTMLKLLDTLDDQIVLYRQFNAAADRSYKSE